MKRVEVLVVGAGPTGLMLAGWLARHKVDVMVVDPNSEVCPESRALAVHARSMETYDQLGIGEEALARGCRGQGVSVWLDRRRLTRIGLEAIGEGISPHPYIFILSQDQNEAILYEHLRRHGGDVVWGHKLIHLSQTQSALRATIEGPRGREEVEALYVCGCRVLPRVVAFFMRFPAVARLWFRVLSQTSISYRASWTSLHQAPSAPVKAGDRLPWVSWDGGAGNFEPLRSCDWQAHVYGESDASLRGWSGLPVHRFDFCARARRAGLLRDAVYLVRPDGYIGMVCRPFDAAAADQYLRERGAVRLL